MFAPIINSSVPASLRECRLRFAALVETSLGPAPGTAFILHPPKLELDPLELLLIGNRSDSFERHAAFRAVHRMCGGDLMQNPGPGHHHVLGAGRTVDVDTMVRWTNRGRHLGS